MNNLEIPADAWQTMIERAAQNSNEPVSWTGKAINEAPGHEGEIDVTYIATYHGNSMWSFDVAIPCNVPPSNFTVWHGRSRHGTEIRTPGYRRKQRSPARMSKEWRERRKAMERH